VIALERVQRGFTRMYLSWSVSAMKRAMGGHGGTVVSTAASQLPGTQVRFPARSLSVQSLHVLPVSAWVSSGCSGFLPQSERHAG